MRRYGYGQVSGSVLGRGKKGSVASYAVAAIAVTLAKIPKSFMIF